MKTHVWWALLCSVALLHAGVVVADQSSTGSNQSSQTTTSSTTSQTKANPSVKVTVVKSTVVPWARQTTQQPTTVGASTSTPAKPPAPPKPTTQRETPPNPGASRPAKPRAARPALPKPDAASTPAPARTPDAGIPASTQAPEGIITVEGSIDAMDLKAVPPTLQVRLSFGPVWTMILDPATTSIVDGERLGTMDDVRVHDKVSVAYAPKNGQRLVKSLELKKPPTRTPGPSGGK